MKSPPDPDPAHVLVVEDDDALRHLACRFLARAGFEYSEAGRRDEAMRALVDTSCDLVLLDWGLGGLELLEAIGQARPDMPVLIMSGHLPDPRAMHAPNFAGWRTKPFSRQELCQAVQAALRCCRGPGRGG